MFGFSKDRADLASGAFKASQAVRAAATSLSLVARLALGGCPTPPPPKVEPPPPPGDTMRLMGKVGDKASGTVKVRLEKGEVGAKKGPKVFAFQLEEEHTVEKADADGNMHV